MPNQRPGSAHSDAVAKAHRPYAPRMAPEQRREQLLDAALSVILEQGYSGVSIEAIARAAGVTRPVIYDHFSDLGRLLYALIEREERYALAQLDKVVPAEFSGVPSSETLVSSVRRLLEEITIRPATWRLILLPPAGTPAVVREHVERNRERTLERIERMVRSGLRGVRPELDLELTAQAIHDLAEEAGRRVLTDPTRYTPERYEQFVASFVALIWPGEEAGV